MFQILLLYMNIFNGVALDIVRVPVFSLTFIAFTQIVRTTGGGVLPLCEESVILSIIVFITVKSPHVDSHHLLTFSKSWLLYIVSYTRGTGVY